MARRTKVEELLDFEIAFYEKLLNAHPGFVDAMVPLAEAYTRRGLHEKGLAVDLRLTHLKQEDPVIWYNLACSYSLLNRLDEAFDALKRSVSLGYDDPHHLRLDPDLANLRQSSKHRGMISVLFTGSSGTPTAGV